MLNKDVFLSKGRILLGENLHVTAGTEFIVDSDVELVIPETSQLCLAGGKFAVKKGGTVTLFETGNIPIAFSPNHYSGGIEEATNYKFDAKHIGHFYSVSTADELAQALNDKGTNCGWVGINMRSSISANFNIVLNSKQGITFDGYGLVLSLPANRYLTVGGRIYSGYAATDGGEIRMNLSNLRFEGNGFIHDTVKLTNISA